ncbi:MAG TPA: hypothetical protein VIV60_11015 [Polyangiaceae bacterium]
MNEMKRWLDELPADSPDRALLAAGEAARPPNESREVGWQALTVALGTVSAVATVTSKAAATATLANANAAGVAVNAQAHAGVASAAVHAATSAGVAGALPVAAVTKTAVGVTGLSLGLKSVTVGFVVGVAMLGAGTAVEHAIERETRAPAASGAASAWSVRQVAARERSSGTSRDGLADRDTPTIALSADVAAAATEAVRPLPHPSNAPAAQGAEQAILPNSNAAASARVATDEATVRSPAPAPLGSAQGTLSQPPLQPDGAERIPLAEQARELAQIQRLMQAGATAEALRRLELNRRVNALSGLGEERDALYVQALAKAQHTDQARFWGKRFLEQYPNSAHAEKIRRLVRE